VNASNLNSMGSLSDIVSHIDLLSIAYCAPCSVPFRLQLWIIALIFRCDIFFLDHLYCKLMLRYSGSKKVLSIYQESFKLHFFVWSFFNPSFSFEASLQFFLCNWGIYAQIISPFCLDDEVFLGYLFSFYFLLVSLFLSLKRTL